MSNSLQNLLATFMETAPNPRFLDLVVFNNTNGGASANTQNNALAAYLAKIFLAADTSLYLGCVVTILVLGYNYRESSAAELTAKLCCTSLVFIYLSLIINLFGLSCGFTYLTSATLSIFENSYTFTLFTQAGKLFLLVVAGALYVLFPAVYRSKRMRSIELPLLIQIALALSVTLVSSTNFALLLLALEGFSLILYIMTALGRTYGGVTAAAKYFAFGTLGSVFLFWGVVHVYALVPSLSFRVVQAVLQYSTLESYDFINSFEFATTAIAFGFMLKLGAAPAHQWVADVYAGSHMFVTAFFSIFVKLVLFIIFISIATHFNCDYLLKFFILFSLVVGCIMSLRQTEIKRLLAYSSIVHVAFLLMGDFISSITYLVTYVISSLLLFSVLLNLELAGKEIIYLNDLRLVRGSSYLQVFSLVLSLASSAGLPPFAGFYGKFMVWSSIIEDLYLSNEVYSYLVLLLSVMVSLITIFYYMRLIAYLFVSDDSYERRIHLTAWAFEGRVSSAAYLQCILCALLVLWTFIQSSLLGIVQHIALIH
jgi:NADH-quinone oxidoreductase subunit N